MKQEIFLTAPETARKLKITFTYLYSLLRSGRLPGTKVAGKWQIPQSEIDARLKARQQ